MAGLLARIAASLAPTPGRSWFRPSERDRYLAGPVGTRYTKDQIAAFLSSARYGDTRALSSFKAEMRASDPDLDSHIRKLESLLTQAPLELTRWPSVPAGTGETESPEDRLSEDVATYCREQLLDPDVRIGAAIVHALWGLLDGVSGFQVVVKPGGSPGGKEKLLALDPVPSERFRWETGSAVLGVQPGEDATELIPVSDLRDSIAVVVVEPGNFARDRVGSLRRCITPWLTRRNGLEWWGRNVELFGIPFRKATYKLDSVRDDLETALAGMGSAGYGVFPDGTDVEFVAGASAASRSAHQDLVEYCERAMAKALLGSTQTADVQVGAGSKASASVHLDVVERFAEAYGRAVCEVLREQVLKPLVRRNFGAEAAERLVPVPVLRVRSHAELLSFFQAMETAGKAGMKTIPVSWIHAQTGIPLPEDDEQVLEYGGGREPNAPAGPAGAAGGPPSEPPPGNEPPPADEGATARSGETVEPVTQSAGSPPSGKPGESPPKTLARLEQWVTGHSRGAGDAVLAPYAALIEEVQRDGGDLGHLASRVRLQAQMAGRDHSETAEILAAVMAEALLTGFASEH